MVIIRPACRRLLCRRVTHKPPAAARGESESVTDTKVCTKCRLDLPLGKFGPDAKSADGRRSRCRDCRSKDALQQRKDNPAPSREAARKYRQANPDAASAAVARWREANPGYHAKILARTRSDKRAAVFDHYGWSCACCGATENLTIDHINGDGMEHRATSGIRSGTDTYRWLVANGFPDGFQALCLPCNT